MHNTLTNTEPSHHQALNLCRDRQHFSYWLYESNLKEMDEKCQKKMHVALHIQLFCL